MKEISLPWVCEKDSWSPNSSKRISDWPSIICSSSLSQIIIINLFHTYVLLHNHDAVSMYLRLQMSWIVYHLGYSPGPHPQRWRHKRQAQACSAARVSNSLKEGNSMSHNSGGKQLHLTDISVWKTAYHHASFGKLLLCIPPASACCPRVGLLQGHHSGKQIMWLTHTLRVWKRQSTLNSHFHFHRQYSQ